MSDLTDVKFFTLRNMLKLHEENKLKVDRTYQRASNWDEKQQKFFLDSLLREFPLPSMYLYHYGNVYFIVDGQQRQNAIIRFLSNKIALLDPKKDKLFPAYIREGNDTCEWANCFFNKLSNIKQEEILDYEIPVHILEIGDDEIRDLFVRLQRGVPLTGQQKRDASCGNFNTFILQIGGKIEERDSKFILDIHMGLEAFPGDPFFSNMHKQKKVDKGQIRKHASNCAMLYFNFVDNGIFVDINDKKLDAYYDDNVAFELEGVKAKDFKTTLDILYNKLWNINGREIFLENHEAMHLVLFTKCMRILGLRGWEDCLLSAFEKFRGLKVTDADYDIKYGNHVRSLTIKSETIRIRHKYFSKNMFNFIVERMGSINYSNENDIYSNELLNYFKVLLKQNEIVDENLLEYFFCQSGHFINNKKPHKRRKVKDVSNLKVILKNGDEIIAKNCNVLVPMVVPDYENNGANNKALIFGTYNPSGGCLRNPDELFWSKVQSMTCSIEEVKDDAFITIENVKEWGDLINEVNI